MSITSSNYNMPACGLFWLELFPFLWTLIQIKENSGIFNLNPEVHEQSWGILGAIATKKISFPITVLGSSISCTRLYSATAQSKPKHQKSFWFFLPLTDLKLYCNCLVTCSRYYSGRPMYFEKTNVCTDSVFLTSFYFQSLTVCPYLTCQMHCFLRLNWKRLMKKCLWKSVEFLYICSRAGSKERWENTLELLLCLLLFVFMFTHGTSFLCAWVFLDLWRGYYCNLCNFKNKSCYRDLSHTAG